MKRMVVIGAGFSGAVTTIQLLRHLCATDELTIINRSGKMAKGLAYGTNSPLHLLNVPVGNMSALADEPDSFLEFCLKTDSTIHSGSFVSRALYGSYLEGLLETEEAKSPVRCTRLTAEVSSIRHTGKEAVLMLNSGETVFADHVILALGNFAPHQPHSVELVKGTAAYVGDPWSLSGSAPPRGGCSILLIGSGLTAVDALISLQQSSPHAVITMISRRGLLPHDHRAHLPGVQFKTAIQADVLNTSPSAVQYLRAIRREVARSPEHWREIITALRPVTSQLWQRLPHNEKRRFLRHLQPYWDIHRHRLAPQTYRIFKEALENKRATVIAGRIKVMSLKDGRVEVEFRRRGHLTVERIWCDQVINCTGPCSNVETLDDGLICDLRGVGIVSSDPLKLGINVDDSYRVIGGDGAPLPWLSYVGPMLRAQHWEATAVPELRRHAQLLASKL